MICWPPAHLNEFSLNWVCELIHLSIEILSREFSVVSQLGKENQVHIIVKVSESQVWILFLEQLELRDKLFNQNCLWKFKSEIWFTFNWDQNRPVFFNYFFNVLLLNNLMNSWVKDEGLELGQEFLDHFNLNSESRIWWFRFSELNNQQFQLALQVSSNIFVSSFFNTDFGIDSYTKSFLLGNFMDIF